MPYIEERMRTVANERGLARLCETIGFLKPQVAAGVAAFSIFQILRALAIKGRFWRLALAGGVVIFALLEFYRRVVAPYEDDKKAENGDVL